MEIKEAQKYDNPIGELSKFSLSKLSEMGLPNQRVEKWKYTDLAKYFPEMDITKQAQSKLEYTLNPLFSNLVFINGELAHSDKDISIKKLCKENQKDIELIKEKNTKLLSDEAVMHLIEAHGLNQYFLELKKENKILIQHINTSEFAKHTSSHLHILAETNSSSHLLETYSSTEEASGFINCAKSVYVKENASLDITYLQELNDKSSIINNTRAVLARDAKFKNITIDLGSSFSRNNLAATLDADNAETTISGVYNLMGSQHHDTNSFISHNAPHTYSHQLYKGVMKDKSHGIFTGLIKVEKDAQLIESNQLNKNLVLHKGAHAHSRPQLEIFADDVKCSHGSTTGQISEDELFYFNARGIPSDKARKILARAFSNDVLLKIKDQDIFKLAKEALIKKEGQND
tara:strand:+ start:26666 stop:27874 length:1209 start_codon:yes stop_codon:yes gene_type:complete